ncbi:MAG: hypothetical protein E4G99_11445 [Anaerolineales bacterium]|nr:MAG: hypothetical protein E4G99_11445 [Anaerolineales bacterium]
MRAIGSEAARNIAAWWREIIFFDELLDSVGEFGEVRLEVKNRKLRFASRTESIDPLKYEVSK